MNHNRYLVNRIHDTIVLGRYQATPLATGIPKIPPQMFQLEMAAKYDSTSLKIIYNLVKTYDILIK